MKQEINAMLSKGYGEKINIIVFVNDVEYRMEVSEAERIIASSLLNGYEVSKTSVQKYSRIKQKV
jgi:hypothetical protein